MRWSRRATADSSARRAGPTTARPVGAGAERRGGGDDDDDDEDEDEEEEEEDEDDDAHLFDDDEDEGAVSDADFEGDSLKARAKKAWAATPPVTQVYVGSSLALTLGSFFLAGNQWPSWLNLDWKKVMTGQLWSERRLIFLRTRAMTTYVCRPSRNRYVSSAIFLSFNIRAPLVAFARMPLITDGAFTARARRRPFTGFLYYGPFGLSCC